MTATKKSPACTLSSSALKLTKLNQKQAKLIGVKAEGPFKPELYQY